MSYCRFSSANWGSDVYVYEDYNGGWTTHVASRRRRFGPIPDLVGGRFSMFLHHWAGAEWSKDSRKVEYPQAWKGFLYGRLWCGLLAFWHSKIHLGSLHLIPLRDIGLPHDGARFNDETPGECADTLLMLRSCGYVVPQYAVDALREEEAERVQHPRPSLADEGEKG